MVDEYSNQFILITTDANISDKEQVPYFQQAFYQFEETQRDTWVRQGEETAQLIWKEKMTHLLWETKREYIEGWGRRTFFAMTSGYHNLVLWWNVHTLPHPYNPRQTISDTSCRLMDDREMEASVFLLE
ncbi:hypothetical protein HETIRDRAFT_454229 [Heterobasidion irregulare TC 32-1]|uniref:Uncharacterized protein n=1 Tax=Heterobasidion irregulare (strain TC 32-1) TaxID=747525 RepID=W4JZB2_HETIT|nr:uncharacterized protein HETIRDRAFT_454229 [Heterobasidion irregulare TC 32-1]ETW78211.1 hypothetical protein HETIRDRAFT_454229 [Heterobasidion irregulare TC 32-1]